MGGIVPTVTVRRVQIGGDHEIFFLVLIVNQKGVADALGAHMGAKHGFVSQILPMQPVLAEGIPDRFLIPGIVHSEIYE